MKSTHRGKLVVLHLAIRYPFAGVVWQLLHHLVGFRRLGFDVYYIEDGGGQWVCFQSPHVMAYPLADYLACHDHQKCYSKVL